MPRCLMAKKWKAYPWPDRADEPIIDIEEEEEIDVVGDSPANAGGVSKPVTTATATITSVAPTSSCWGPSSPTAGATAPSPPPHSPEATRGSTILYNGENGLFMFVIIYRTFYTYTMRQIVQRLAFLRVNVLCVLLY